MGQALYRKYRPRRLEDVAGQEHITQTLAKALKSNNISHAYLFTGPRGVGKTSVARIFAHEVNDLAYENDVNHIDIIEIDAASNRRIDEIRDLRDKVYVTPSEAKYKVYIIDEVHMLTKEAFNALLKTLEEPPEHVIFILATTDAHKLPETIISRTQRYSFKPIDTKSMTKHLAAIAAKENIDVNNEALSLLAEHADGSLRDSESLLDQARNYNEHIDEKVMAEILGIPSAKVIKNLETMLIQGTEVSDLISLLNDLYRQGYQASSIASQLSHNLRELVIKGSDESGLLDLLYELVEVPTSYSPEQRLEIILLKFLPQVSVPIATKQPEKQVEEPMPEEEQHYQPTEQIVDTIVDTIIEPPDDDEQRPKESLSIRTSAVVPADDELWIEILKSLKQRHNTLYGVAKMAEASLTKDTLTLSFAFEFHKKRLSEQANKQILTDIAKQLTGQPIIIECKVNKDTKPKEPSLKESKVHEEPVDLSTISNIFNGAELLES